MQTNVSAYQADSLVQVSRIVVIVWIVGVVLADTLIRRIDPLIESRLTSALFPSFLGNYNYALYEEQVAETMVAVITSSNITVRE